MEEVSPIKDNDDIQAMKDYLREWNEMYYMLFMALVQVLHGCRQLVP